MGHSLFLGCPFLSAPFIWPIKPQSLFIDYKSPISFFSPQLSSEPQTCISDSLIQLMAPECSKGYMAIHFSLPVHQITYLSKRRQISSTPFLSTLENDINTLLAV